MVQNLTRSGEYPRNTLPSDLLQKVLKLVPMKETGPEFYVVIMITVISDSYASLVETLNHRKSIKLNDLPGENVADFCDTILVDDEHLVSAGAFNLKNLGYII